MKVVNYVCCVFVLACLTNLGQSEKAQGKVEQQFMDPLTTDESMKMKRPFCNAFTGRKILLSRCGRKRSFHENPVDSQDVESRDSIRLPLSFYKALLRAASQNIRNTIDRDVNEYQLSGIPQMYFSGKTPLHKRFEVPPTSLV